MQPAMTVSLHWPERSESGISLQSIVIGTCSFDSAFYLSKKNQKKLKKKNDENFPKFKNLANIPDSSSSSSNWTDMSETSL